VQYAKHRTAFVRTGKLFSGKCHPGFSSNYCGYRIV